MVESTNVKARHSATGQGVGLVQHVASGDVGVAHWSGFDKGQPGRNPSQRIG